MGIAHYDPAALGRPAWNAGRHVFARTPPAQFSAEINKLILQSAQTA